MNHSTQNRPTLRPAPASRTSIRTTWIAMVGACAFISTAYWLGEHWLSDTAFALPAGLWIVIAATLTGWLIDQKPRAIRPSSFTHSFRAPTHASPSPDAPISLADPRTCSVQALAPLGGPPLVLPGRWKRLGASLARATESPSSAEAQGFHATLARTLDARARGSSPIRVGLRLDAAASGALTDAPTPCDAQWFRVHDHADARAVCAAHGLDALVSLGREDRLIITTPENHGQDAAWFDWGTERPITYLSVFPMRLDCAGVTFPGATRASVLASPDDALAVRALVHAAAVLSRHPARLSLADRVIGRRSALVPASPGSLDPIASALFDLAGAAELGTTRASPQARLAARVSSAWLSTYEGGLSDDDRSRLIESAGIIAGDEAEVMLRVAAVRVALLDEKLGIDAILRADRMLRERSALDGFSHLDLIGAELEHGTFADMTVGRVAAGICMACSTTPTDRIPFLRDDLLDDMRFAGWLVGRDQERAILMDVFRQLERARRTEDFSLPAGTGKGLRIARKPASSSKSSKPSKRKKAA